MPGFGSAPFGAAPYGIGTPDVEYTPGGKALAIPGPNPSARQPRELARFIDPVTKRFVVDSYGHHSGMDAVQQQVYLAIRTVRGRAIPETLGNTVSLIKDIGDGFEEQVRSDLLDALQGLISARRIRVVTIDVDRFPDMATRAFIRVRWVNLSNGREYETNG